jgi:cytochrome b6-f complex iron-sulfur subunit
MAIIVIGVVVILGLAAVFLLATARHRAETGRLSRETKKADAGTPDAPGTDLEPVAATDEGGEGAVPVPAADRTPVRYEPVDEEELGVTRRQFFNRGILTGFVLSLSGFGAASLAFLWPTASGTSGTKVNVGSVDDVQKSIDDKQPFYNASAKVYIQPYPKDDVPKASKVYPSTITAGMAQGFVALYQKCPHLGCRVPWCQTSQWFECPCHGSKYNRVGEKRGGPAPRGMDRFPLEVSGNAIVVDTDSTKLVQGPPIGTDTTGQGQEGAPCV